MYSVLVCVQVLRNSGVITDSEWDVFLHGGTLKLMSSACLECYVENFRDFVDKNKFKKLRNELPLDLIIL